LLLGLASLGCDHDAAAPQEQPPAQKPQPAPKATTTKKIEVGKNVFLEIEGKKRRVLVKSEVCRRMDQLEHLLCCKRLKDHEAILTADVDARHIHAALILAGAEPGSPVKYAPKRMPPIGTTIKITLQYVAKGETVTVPAQRWIRNIKTMKELQYDWVFAGSTLIPDPLDKKAEPFYARNDGDVICLANFQTAMLDLPIESSRDANDLAYEAFTERIPALDTQVWVILEPVPTKKQ